MQPCVYATSGWGIHDDRWCAALREVGYEATAISLGRDVATVDELARRVSDASGSGAPVLAGPLHSVTRALVDLPARVVGLSWGYDLGDMDAEGQDTSWLPRLDGLVLDSQANVDIVLRAGVPREAVTFLPWGVDLSVFTLQGSRTLATDIDLPDASRLIVTLRAHEPRYRVGDVVAAFARTSTPDLALVIGNSGSLTDELKAQVERLGIAGRTRFIGSVPEADLAPLLRAAAVYATAAEVDGTSVTLLQAMAVGTPVVASASAGNLGWITEGQTGLLFPVGDIEALTHAIDHAAAASTAIASSARALVVAEADWHANLPRLRQALSA